LVAPSPKKATATSPDSRIWFASACPVAAAIEPPMIPKQPISPWARSMTFIDPARPPQTPVLRPSSSAISASGATPMARAAPCPR
jgi:hypothetical protein